MVRSLPTTPKKLGNDYKGKRPLIEEEDSDADLDSVQLNPDYYFDRMRRCDRIAYTDDVYYGSERDAPSMDTDEGCKKLKRRGHPGHFVLPLKDYVTGNKIGFGMIDTREERNIMPLGHLRGLGYAVPDMNSIPEVNYLDGTRTVIAGSIKLKVKIGSFVYPVEFLVLDIPYDRYAQCILGSAFLCTSRAIIDYLSESILLSVEKSVESYKLVYLPDYTIKHNDLRRLTVPEYQALVDKEIHLCPFNYERHSDRSMFSIMFTDSVSESSDANSFTPVLSRTARMRCGGKKGRNEKRIDRRSRIVCGRQLTLLGLEDNFRKVPEEGGGSNHDENLEENPQKKRKE